ncbi:MAG: zinc ribbon domain-containing protein [Clostridia bacterium]|nr:zinc ribbon domain-containing protein [Clostridia bacterium]
MNQASNTPKTCSSCGATLSGEQKFCHVCGSQYTPPTPKNLCKTCGAELLTQAVFCARCGTSVYATESAPAPAPVPNPEPASASTPTPEPSPVPNSISVPAPAPAPARICASCGATLSDGQKFCLMCGTEYAPARKRFCRGCGSELVMNAPFCAVCGTPALASAPAVTPVRPAAPKRKKSFGFSIVDLVKRSSVLLLSVLLLISVFFPVLNTDVELDDDITLTLEYSAFDGVLFFIDSFDSIEVNDLEDTDLAEELMDEYEDLADKYADDWEDGDDLDKFSPLVKKGIRLVLQSELIDPSVNMGVCAVLCLLYAILVICVFIYALLSFIALFKSTITNRLRSCVKLIALVPGAVCVLAAAFNVSGYTPEFGTGIDSIIISDVSTGGWMIFAVVASLAVLLLFTLLRLLNRTAKAFNVRDLVKRLCACGLSAVLMLFTFASIIDITVDVEFENKSRETEATSSVDATMFEQMVLSQYEQEAFEDTEHAYKFDMIEWTFDRLGNYTKREFTNGEAYYYELSIIQWSVLSFGGYQYSWAFGLGGTAVTLIALMAAILLWKNLFALAEGTPAEKRWTIPAKIFAILAAAIVIALIFVIGALVASNAKVEFAVAPGLNAYFMLAAAIALACVPMGKTKARTLAPTVSTPEWSPAD